MIGRLDGYREAMGELDAGAGGGGERSGQAQTRQAGSNRAAGILARQDRIEVWALPWFYLAIIGTGYFFTFYDIADIGFALPQIQTQFGLTGNESTFLALAIGLIGYAVGSIVIGSLADRLGRFRMLIVTIVLTAFGSFGDAASQSLTMLVVFRFITGMGVGADLNLVSTYIGEMAPARLRGRAAPAPTDLELRLARGDGADRRGLIGGGADPWRVPRLDGSRHVPAGRLHVHGRVVSDARACERLLPV
jgi:hypothetical protein